MKIVIAGATGLVGNLVLNNLKKKNQCSVIAITRSPINVEANFSNLTIDWDSWVPIKLDADTFICCLGTTIKVAGSKENFKKVDFDYVKKIAESAKLSNAKKFIVISANSANPKSTVFYNQVKGEMEEMLKSYHFEGLAILRPSLLIGDRIEKRPMEKVAQLIMPKIDFLLQGTLKKYQTIKAETVANAVVTLVNKSWNGVQIFESDELNSKEFLPKN